ncbi:MAG: hypothetical protein ACXWQE_11125 [Bdellovibrionales bacterium]
MDLSKALDSLKFDTRMKDWNLKQGIVTKDDLDKNIKGLKDDAANSEEVTLEDKGDFEG